MSTITRRVFLGSVATASAVAGHTAPAGGLVEHLAGDPDGFDLTAYRGLLGAANAFKEGDAIVGVAAADDEHRRFARGLLAATRLADIDAHPPFVDDLQRALMADRDVAAAARISGWTVGGLKAFLLEQDGEAVQAIMPGLSSDAIACVVRVMTDAELTTVGGKIFNTLPGSTIGGPGRLAARLQPNSPTDNLEDIRWQVFDGWAYGVGDLLLGTNPVSSDPDSVLAVERCLADVVRAFGLQDVLPHCVLAHIDVQAEVERRSPGSTALWFQSIAGSDAANGTFDLTLAKMVGHARTRTGRYGLYFETGQGADFTNGHAHGCDMVLHEARKYGFARLLARRVAAAHGGFAWVHLNDVAGFIGPEVFRTREQLVRCCLEDIVMGKLHGLCIGLDVCSTLHMDVSLADLDWCLERIVPAAPAYLMALPTKIDPMLGYLTTAFQDHVRLRERFGLRVDDHMAAFFAALGVLDAQGRPGPRFGDPGWVHLQYRRRLGDGRSDDAIRMEGRQEMAAVRARGVFLAEGRGPRPWDHEPGLDRELDRIYVESKRAIRAELDPAFFATHPDAIALTTRSRDRDDYLLHPATGERLDEPSAAAVTALRRRQDARFDVQIVASDGLNALAIADAAQLDPFLEDLRARLAAIGCLVAPDLVVVRHGRVRAGYEIGRRLFGGLPGPRTLLHVIGERPGTGHRTFSVYATRQPGDVWSTPGAIDHNLTRVVAGIAATALAPPRAAEEVARLVVRM
jgi:ethanolamine ammonia-lyase large subunit